MQKNPGGKTSQKRGLGPIATRSSSGGSTRSDASDDLGGLLQLASQVYSGGTSSSSSSSTFSPTRYVGESKSSEGASASGSPSTSASSSSLSSATIPLANPVFGSRVGGSVSLPAGSPAPVAATTTGGTITAGASTPFTEAQKELLRQNFLMVENSPMLSKVTNSVFADADLRAVLNGNQTSQQRIHHMKHIAEILKSQLSAGQLSDAAKINVQQLLRTLQSKIALAEQGESLAAGIRPPPGTTAATAAAAPVRAPMGCPCPELVAAIQALGATMGSAGSAAIQAQISAIQQQLTALQTQSSGLADAERRIAQAETRSNAAQAEVIRLQGELTAARASATAAGSSSSAPDRSAEIAGLRTDLATAQGELATARADLATARADLATARADLATAQGELTASAAQHTNAITLKDGEIAGLTANITTLNAQIAAMQATTAQSASNATASTDELRQANSELLAQLGAATTAHAEEKGGLEAQVAAITALHVQQQAAAAKCNQELAKIKSDQEVFLGNMDIGYGMSTFQEISDGYLAVTTELSVANKKVADSNEQVAEAEARIAQLEPENAMLTSESASKTQEIENLRAELAALKATSDNRIANAETSSQAEAAAKAELTERLATIEAAKAACDTAATKTAADLASLRGELDVVRGALDAKTRALETVERSVGESNRILDDLRRLLPNGHDFKDSVRSIQKQLEAATAAKTACEGIIADKTTKLEQIQNEIAQKVAQIATIQSALDAEKQKSVGLNDQLKAAQEKTAANVAAARATATTAQQSALDEMQAQLRAATDAAEKARIDCEISTQLKDGKIANLEAQVQHYINRCGNVLQKVAIIDRAVEERSRSRASSIDASSGVPQTYASAAAKAPHTTVPGGVGKGGGTKLASVAPTPSASFEGVEFARNPLYTEKTSLLPSSGGQSSGTSLFSRFGLGGATPKTGRKVGGDTLLTSNPMFSPEEELITSGSSMSLPPIPIKSGISKVTPQPSFEFGEFKSNPLRATTSSTPETASVPAVSVRSPPAAPGGKSSAQSTDGIVSTSNPYARSNKLQTKTNKKKSPRKTRKNRK